MNLFREVPANVLFEMVRTVVHLPKLALTKSGVDRVTAMEYNQTQSLAFRLIVTPKAKRFLDVVLGELEARGILREEDVDALTTTPYGAELVVEEDHEQTYMQYRNARGNWACGSEPLCDETLRDMISALHHADDFKLASREHLKSMRRN